MPRGDREQDRPASAVSGGARHDPVDDDRAQPSHRPQDSHKAMSALVHTMSVGGARPPWGPGLLVAAPRFSGSARADSRGPRSRPGPRSGARPDAPCGASRRRVLPGSGNGRACCPRQGCPDRRPGSGRTPPRWRSGGSREYKVVVTTAVGAHVEIRTRDLFLTKEVLCRLSYVGPATRRLYPVAEFKRPPWERLGRGGVTPWEPGRNWPC